MRLGEALIEVAGRSGAFALWRILARRKACPEPVEGAGVEATPPA